ncbi:MAG: uracil-DNA glycosylase [Proteobacteria bacterium]|nr:uracil-DNA glycosylase [Pseudomonadota bacterium]
MDMEHGTRAVRMLLGEALSEASRALAGWLEYQRELGADACPVLNEGSTVMAAAASPVVVCAVEAARPLIGHGVSSEEADQRVKPLAGQTGDGDVSGSGFLSKLADFRRMQVQQTGEVDLCSLEARQGALDDLKGHLDACRLCALGSARRGTVSGRGPVDASIMFVAAGGNPCELDEGRIMPGESGMLFDKIVSAMASLEPEASSDRIYMTNAIKCACVPPRHLHHEIAMCCLSYLREEVRLISPKVIVVWGETAYRALFGSGLSLIQARGKAGRFEGVPAVATHHPVEVLRNPQLKARVWDDVRFALSFLKS